MRYVLQYAYYYSQRTIRRVFEQAPAAKRPKRHEHASHLPHEVEVEGEEEFE